MSFIGGFTVYPLELIKLYSGPFTIYIGMHEIDITTIYTWGSHGLYMMLDKRSVIERRGLPSASDEYE